VARAIEGWRSGRGEPLVLIHGAEACWPVWRPVLGRLAEYYGVHAIVLPGHLGGEPLGQAPVSIGTFADSVEGYLDAVGLPAAHVAGNSLGGILATEMVRRGRARSAVSFSGPSAVDGDAQLKRLLRLFAIGAVLSRVPLVDPLAVRSPRFRRVVLAGAMVHGERVSAAEFTETIAAGRAADIALPLVRDVRKNGLPKPMSAGGVPVIVAWGARDKVVPFTGYGEPSSRLVAGTELRMIQDAGHVPMWDAPDAVVRTIRDATARAGS
jgi:pimeloyl-ACP methyl ester carboxylesterase